ncbi:hypothetical protein CEXT_108161 [Caerostris extrusa]|uniref:Transmembrane protein n=1 Tax=Caerostris extrusa TaxID=172846 RepID=A0AAV4XT82_CAEEX|nr:hypothetical protein CEXT_108161 [Caerostris extrusa]
MSGRPSAFITLDDSSQQIMERSLRMCPPQGRGHEFHFCFSGMRAVKIASAVVAGFRPTLNSRERLTLVIGFLFLFLLLHNSSTRRFKWMRNKRAATGRDKRSTLTMTERDKVRDAPSVGKQAATGTRGSSVLPHSYNLSGRDIYL